MGTRVCIFTGVVERVSRTRILARGRGARQGIAYAMSVAGASEQAMVLPIPVPPGAREGAVHFVDLQHYPDLFDDLERGFPFQAQAQAAAALGREAALSAAPLPVHVVGSFEASFVPDPGAFARLDPRFRLPRSAVDALPGYHDHGFVVFALRGLGRQETAYHPMAFDFPRRDPRVLFFPTVHVHDGRVHATADFDHVLYAQADGQAAPDGWAPSHALAHRFVDVARAAGLVDGDRPCHRRELRGRLRNQDTPLPAATPAEGADARSLRDARAQLAISIAQLQAGGVSAGGDLLERSVVRVEALRELLALADHPERAVRAEVGRLLTAFGERTGAQRARLEAATGAVQAGLTRRDPSALRAALAATLPLAGSADPSLVEAWLAWIDAGDPHLRLSAARLLAAAPAVPADLPGRALAQVAVESDADVRDALIALLVRMGPVPEVVTGLARLLGEGKWALRRLAAQALGRLGAGARAAVPALRKMAEGPEESLADEARQALSRIRR